MSYNSESWFCLDMEQNQISWNAVKYSANPLWCVEMNTLQGKFPYFRTAQAKRCKYTHVGCPEVLHSGRIQTSFCWSSGALLSHVDETDYVKRNSEHSILGLSELQKNRVEDWLCNCVRCLWEHLCSQTSKHSFWQDFGKCLSIQAETNQGEKEGSWAYQFVVSIFYTYQNILNCLKKPLVKLKKTIPHCA